MTPLRTALECLDLTQPCRSIFDRKKDLAVNTLRRVVRGLVKFTIETADPCIVQVNHAGDEFRGKSIFEPLPTLSAKHGFGLGTPFIAGCGGRAGQSPETPVWLPVGTITGKNDRVVIAPHITQYNGLKGGEVRGFGLADPFNALPTENRFGFVSAFLFEHANSTWNHGSRSIVEPMPTLTATPKGGSWNVVAPLIVPFTAAVDVGLFAAQGFDLRQLDVRQPAKLPPTVRAAFGGALHQGFVNSGSFRIFGRVDVGEAHAGDSIVAPLAVKFYKSGIVKSVDEPLDSITSRDRFGYAAAHLTKLRGSGGWSSLADPIDTICAGATTFGLTTAFITHLRGTHGRGIGGYGLSMFDPLPTITGSNHLFLTTGALYESKRRANHFEAFGADGVRTGIHRWFGTSEAGAHRFLVNETGRRHPFDNHAGERPDGKGTGADHHSRFSAASGLSDATIYTPRELIGPSDNPAINRGFWRVYDLLRRFLGDAAPLPIVRRIEANEWGIERVVEYLIYDIGMRMLTPRELLNAQFSPELAKDYILTGTRESQVAKIGNSVCPLAAAAIVKANLDEPEEFEVAA